jgi:hypothetical protein
MLAQKLLNIFNISIYSLVFLGFINSQEAVLAQQVLENGKTINGRIDSSSSPVGINGDYRPGNEYTFNTEVGTSIRIDAITDETSQMDVVLVVVPPNLPPIQLDQDLDAQRRETFLQGSAIVGGMWKVKVVSFNKKPGTYFLSLLIKRDGVFLKPEPNMSSGEQVMKKLNLPIVPCGSPDIAAIQVGAETFCTTSYPKGHYIYNSATSSLDSAEVSQLKAWGLTVTSCGAQTASIIISGKELCIVPTLAVPAGKYTFDNSSNQLIPVSSPQTLQTPQTNQAPEQNNF